MPLNEASRKAIRERWPLEFDLTGVPRDTATRKQLLDQRNLDERQILEQTPEDSMPQPNQTTPVRNSFTVDKPEVTITDINNPPRQNYNPHDPKNEYPKMLYHHESGRVLKVNDPREEKASLKRGFDLKPSPHHDYSKVSRAGIAAPAEKVEKREEEMSAEELAALDEQDK
jgi:hypothetical protein